MVFIKSSLTQVLLGAAAISSSLALPTGVVRPTSSPSASAVPHLPLVEVNATLNPLKVEALVQRNGQPSNLRRSHQKPFSGKRRPTRDHPLASETDLGQGKRSWKGRRGSRGTWRERQEDVEHDLINVNLSEHPDGHVGDLLDISNVPGEGSLLRRHHEDEIIIDHDHDHGDTEVDVHKHVHVHRQQEPFNEQLLEFAGKGADSADAHPMIPVADVKINAQRSSDEDEHDNLDARHWRDHTEVVVNDHDDHRHDPHLTIIDERSVEPNADSREHHHHDDEHHDDHHHDGHKRDSSEDDMGGAPGYIDVTSAAFNASSPVTIASLVLATSNDTESNSTFVLNASTNMKTQMYLVPINQTTPGANATVTAPGNLLKVNLKVPVFVASDAMVEPYCATFDGAPTTPSPLTVQPCHNASDVDPHAAQTFLYDPATGIIHPDWQSTPTEKLIQSTPDEYDTDNSTVDSSASQAWSATWSMASASDMPSSTVTGYPVITTSSAANDSEMINSSSATWSASATVTASASALLPEQNDAIAPTISASASAGIAPASSSGPDASAAGEVYTPNGQASNITLIFTPADASMAPQEDDAQAMEFDAYPAGDATMSQAASPSATGNATVTSTGGVLNASSTGSTASASMTSSIVAEALPTPSKPVVPSLPITPSVPASAAPTSSISVGTPVKPSVSVPVGSTPSAPVNTPSVSAPSAGLPTPSTPVAAPALLEMIQKRAYPPAKREVLEKKNDFVVPIGNGGWTGYKAESPLQVRENPFTAPYFWIWTRSASVNEAEKVE